MRTTPLVATLVFLAACAPAPRSEAYFEAHPDETAQVLGAWLGGDHLGAECDAARAADARRKAGARVQSYRKGV
jgi:hypothetical protein